MTIADRAVLVTGANRGIGQALVGEALRRGAKRVYAGTRRPLAHVDGRVTPLTLDVTDAAQIQGAVEHVEYLDILINNAGLALHDDLHPVPFAGRLGVVLRRRNARDDAAGVVIVQLGVLRLGAGVVDCVGVGAGC